MEQHARNTDYGKVIQNSFTTAKVAGLLAVIGLGLLVGRNAAAIQANFNGMWTPQGYTPVAPGLSPETILGLIVALCVAQVGSLFAADAWNNITFTAGEVKNPRRNVPLSLALGTLIVIGLYLCANLAYVSVLTMNQIQHAPSDRVAGAMLQAIFPASGAVLMAVAIMISAFGCINGMVMTGARAYYAMARDGLFFARAASVNRTRVPGMSLVMQGAWAAALVLLRTHDASTGAYGISIAICWTMLVSAALFFYIRTIAGCPACGYLRPQAERPYGPGATRWSWSVFAGRVVSLDLFVLLPLFDDLPRSRAL